MPLRDIYKTNHETALWFFHHSADLILNLWGELKFLLKMFVTKTVPKGRYVYMRQVCLDTLLSTRKDMGSHFCTCHFLKWLVLRNVSTFPLASMPKGVLRHVCTTNGQPASKELQRQLKFFQFCIPSSLLNLGISWSYHKQSFSLHDSS